MKGDEEFVETRSDPKLVLTECWVLKYVLTLSLSKLSLLLVYKKILISLTPIKSIFLNNPENILNLVKLEIICFN